LRTQTRFSKLPRYFIENSRPKGRYDPVKYAIYLVENHVDTIGSSSFVIGDSIFFVEKNVEREGDIGTVRPYTCRLFKCPLKHVRTIVLARMEE
jgi:hypothetical protein